MSIAIIGAGMSGLSAAEILARSGRPVRLFDKGRGAGGRMATRRTSVNGADLTFDHGAQYFTARSPEFRSEVSHWLDTGVVARWDDDQAEGKAGERFVGAPSINSVLKAMASPLDVSWGAEVAAIEGGPGTWSLKFRDGSKAGQFETVIVAVPA